MKSCFDNIKPGDHIYFAYNGNIENGYVVWKAVAKLGNHWTCHSVSVAERYDNGHTIAIFRSTISDAIKIVKAPR